MRHDADISCRGGREIWREAPEWGTVGRFDDEEGEHEGGLDRRERWAEGNDAEDKGKPDNLKV